MLGVGISQGMAIGDGKRRESSNLSFLSYGGQASSICEIRFQVFGTFWEAV